MMKILNLIAPRFSRRRLALSILRDFAYRPSSLFGRLASVNFRNGRACRGLTITCNVCGTIAGIFYDFPDVNIRRAHGIGLLRETLRCKTCAATMRDRQLAAGLLDAVARRTGHTFASVRAWRQADAPTLRVLDSDSFSPINRVLRGMVGYVHTQFRPGRQPSEVLPDGSLNIDLERMTFADASFDVVLTSDVMEHVADDDAAHREIHRCLAPGGWYVCTVPFDPGRYGHRALTVPTGANGGRLVLEHHVHGDPHDSLGIVAHRIYGRQLLDDLQAIGFLARFETIDQPENGVFSGDLIVAVKEG